MDMDTSNTNTTPPTHMTPMGGKKSKTPKVLLSLLVALILLAAGLAGGYFYGQHQKAQAVEQAKQDTQAAAQAEINKAKEATNNQTAPEKTETSATCNADELSLALETADAAAGTYSYNLAMTNVSSRTCTLFGYPGVSLVNDNGNMIGTPAERTQNSQEVTMTLEPQGKVKAVLYAENSDNYSAGECKEGATKVRVYPPNDTGYLSVATVETLSSWCPGFQISPVTGM